MRRLARLLPLLLGCALAPAAADAQAPCAVLAADGATPRTWCDVTTRPMLAIVPAPFPRHSAGDRKSPGTSTFDVVVDSLGGVRVLPSTEPDSAAEHRQALALLVRRWEFEPARVDSTVVSVRMRLDVEYLEPPPDTMPARPYSLVTVTGVGLRVQLGWEPVPPEPPVVTDEELAGAAARALVAVLLQGGAPPEGATLCVAGPADGAAPRADQIVGALATHKVTALPAGMCPQARVTMVHRLDSLSTGTPVAPVPSVVEPVRLQVTQATAWTPELYVVRVTRARGTTRVRYDCEARREANGSVAAPRCRAGRVTMF